MSHCWCPPRNTKIMHTLKYVILFLVFASPMTFKLVRSVLGPAIASGEGLSRPAGLLLHAALFGLVIYILMSTKCGKGCTKNTGSNAAAPASSQDNIQGASLMN